MVSPTLCWLSGERSFSIGQLVSVYISGISYDWIDSILYVSDSNGDIYTINIDTKVVIAIHIDLDNPRAILVVPLER